MENCKADNIAEEFLRSYWKWGKSSLCKKHLYQGLSINSYSVDLSAIKNALLGNLFETLGNLFENTYSRCGAGLQPGTSLVVFLRFFLLDTPVFRKT